MKKRGFSCVSLSSKNKIPGFQNEYLETSASGIYATGGCGPVSSYFTYTAMYEVHIVAVNILQGTQKGQLCQECWVLFSDAEMAVAGLTEAQTVKAGFDDMVGIYDYKKDAATQISGDALGFLKFIVNRMLRRFWAIISLLTGKRR